MPDTDEEEAEDAEVWQDEAGEGDEEEDREAPNHWGVAMRAPPLGIALRALLLGRSNARLTIGE